MSERNWFIYKTDQYILNECLNQHLNAVYFLLPKQQQQNSNMHIEWKTFEQTGTYTHWRTIIFVLFQIEKEIKYCLFFLPINKWECERCQSIHRNKLFHIFRLFEVTSRFPKVPLWVAFKIFIFRYDISVLENRK